VACPWGRSGAMGRGQHGQKRESPRPMAPWEGDEQHHGNPFEAETGKTTCFSVDRTASR
jgi:hypothetical protein